MTPRAVNVIHDSPHLARWLIPVLVGLGVLGLIWYLVSGVRRPTEVATPATAPAASTHLAISNDSGIITVSGRVHDGATRTDIINSLKDVYGATNVKGDLAIDANAGPAPWLFNLHPALEHLKTPGVQAVFDGDTLDLRCRPRPDYQFVAVGIWRQGWCSARRPTEWVTSFLPSPRKRITQEE